MTGIRDTILGFQHRTSSMLGVDEAHRKDTVFAMLANNAKRVPGYWIQLFLAMGIATLGLVLNSTAVVIGAMLVSPLMGPIIELGMGLAVGSSLLVIRSSFRVATSIALVVSCSALLVLVLPFHELNTEISARIAPTALDLLVAIFCALTASYTTVRPGSEAASAAAGTAIGIALVPPLCTVGFGLGTSASNVAVGAGLLFTANLSAIVLFAVFSFLLLGFNQVSAVEVEQDFVAPPERIADFAARFHFALGNFFGSRYGFAVRLLIPVVLLASVFVPLRQALREVTWEVRARDAVRKIVREEIPGAVQTSVTAERHVLSVQVLRVSSASPTENSGRPPARERITTRLQAETGVVPTVAVIEVADARQVSSLAAIDAQNQARIRLAPVGATRETVGSALTEEWPSLAGAVINWRVTIESGDSISLLVSHLGDALPLVAKQLLSRALSGRVGEPVRIVDSAVAATRFTARARHEREWLDSAKVLVALISDAANARACVRGPTKKDAPAPNAQLSFGDTLLATTAGLAGRVIISPGDRWEIHLASADCASASDSSRAHQ